MRDLPEPYSMSEPQNQLYRAWILRLVGRDDEAQSIVNDVGTMLRNWDEGDVAANRAMYAWLMAQYYSLRKDKEQTLRWHREYWNQSFPEGKLDLYWLTDNLPFMAANLADAGLHDEAVELLRRLFDNPGGATWRYIDADPTLDVLDGHPGFEALRDEYGS